MSSSVSRPTEVAAWEPEDSDRLRAKAMREGGLAGGPRKPVDSVTLLSPDTALLFTIKSQKQPPDSETLSTLLVVSSPLKIVCLRKMRCLGGTHQAQGRGRETGV